MLVNDTTLTEAIGDIDTSYNEVGDINKVIYPQKEEIKKIMTKHQLRYRIFSPQESKIHKTPQDDTTAP